MSLEDTTSRATWFVAGAAVGATLALLFAPTTGRDARRRIAKHADRSRDAIADRGREIYEKGKDLADEAAGLFERGRRLVEG
jgi:gas vesicle protein